MTVTTLPAIAVSGPFGAVKEQASRRYTQEMTAGGNKLVSKNRN